MRKTAYSIIFSAFSTLSYAADATYTVCALQAENNAVPVAFIKTCESRSTFNGCSSGGWIVFELNSNVTQSMYASALTAYTTGAQVTLRFDGDTCLGSYDVTRMVRLIK